MSEFCFPKRSRADGTAAMGRTSFPWRKGIGAQGGIFAVQNLCGNGNPAPSHTNPARGIFKAPLWDEGSCPDVPQNLSRRVPSAHPRVPKRDLQATKQSVALTKANKTGLEGQSWGLQKPWNSLGIQTCRGARSSPGVGLVFVSLVLPVPVISQPGFGALPWCLLAPGVTPGLPITAGIKAF